MKNLKKILASLTAVFMMLVCFGTVNVSAATNDGSIEVTDTHKNQEYTLYKLFDATTVANRGENDSDGISYTLMSGKNNFQVTVDENGESKVLDGATWFKLENGKVLIKDSTAYDAITDDNADFIAWAQAYGTQVGNTLTANADDTTIKWEDLSEGYYFITTTTGSLVTVTSIKPNESVKDKNPGTTVKKTITNADSLDEEGENALAQIGTTVDYESRINIARGAYNYKFTDTMSSGLTLNANSVKVYLVEKDAAVADGAPNVNTACGEVEAANSTDANTADITITFNDDWLKANWGQDIVIQYSATVNKDALVGVNGNKNTARIEYGNEDKPITNEDEAKVYSAKIAVKKVNGSQQALEGAGFKLKNSSNEWYYIKQDGTVDWTTNKDNGLEIKPVIATGSTDAVAEFTGLKAGSYTLVETTTPTGYNTAPDTPVTIKPANSTDFTQTLAVTSTVINNSGSELPSTGGMGTTILYVAGGILVLGAAIFFITNKRMQRN